MVGRAKNAQLTEFHPLLPLMKYIQDDENTCCFGCLAPVLYDSGYYFTKQAIVTRIQ